MNIFIDEHRQMLHLLVKHNVQFMLIGGYAVIHYGYERITGDMDIWLQLGNQNRDKLLKAFLEFGFNEETADTLRNMDFSNPVPVFYFDRPPRQIDFITRVSNLRFEDAIKQVNYFSLEGIKIPVIHYNHLILTKSTSNRLKDKADIEELERINRYRRKS